MDGIMLDRCANVGSHRRAPRPPACRRPSAHVFELVPSTSAVRASVGAAIGGLTQGAKVHEAPASFPQTPMGGASPPVPITLSRDEKPHVLGPWGSQMVHALRSWGSARPWGSEFAVGFIQHRGVPRLAIRFSAPPLPPD
ncbi:hypothetical protein L7F22_048672 [Adiantum nelumboides]|nr:hypothetical protein [Adiantum nelumboides]